jgi:hypothetical protein
VHYICQKFSISVVIALAVLVISQPSSATTLSFDVTTLKGVTQIGSVTTTQVGKNVEVTIRLDPGYLLKTEHGYVMFDTTDGLKLTRKSLDGFSNSKIRDTLSHITTIGGFTFTDVFRIDAVNHPKPEHSSSGHHQDKHDQVPDEDDDHAKPKVANHHHDVDRDKENRIVLSALTFMILNADVNQLTGFGLQFCVADESRCGKTGFAETRVSGVSPVPESGTLALIGTGLVGFATMVRRRSSRQNKSVRQSSFRRAFVRYRTDNTVFTR